MSPRLRNRTLALIAAAYLLGACPIAIAATSSASTEPSAPEATDSASGIKDVKVGTTSSVFKRDTGLKNFVQKTQQQGDQGLTGFDRFAVGLSSRRNGKNQLSLWTPSGDTGAQEMSRCLVNHALNNDRESLVKHVGHVVYYKKSGKALDKSNPLLNKFALAGKKLITLRSNPKIQALVPANATANEPISLDLDLKKARSESASRIVLFVELDAETDKDAAIEARACSSSTYQGLKDTLNRNPEFLLAHQTQPSGETKEADPKSVSSLPLGKVARSVDEKTVRAADMSDVYDPSSDTGSSSASDTAPPAPAANTDTSAQPAPPPPGDSSTSPAPGTQGESKPSSADSAAPATAGNSAKASDTTPPSDKELMNAADQGLGTILKRRESLEAELAGWSEGGVASNADPEAARKKREEIQGLIGRANEDYAAQMKKAVSLREKVAAETLALADGNLEKAKAEVKKAAAPEVRTDAAGLRAITSQVESAQAERRKAEEEAQADRAQNNLITGEIARERKRSEIAGAKQPAWNEYDALLKDAPEVVTRERPIQVYRSSLGMSPSARGTYEEKIWKPAEALKAKSGDNYYVIEDLANNAMKGIDLSPEKTAERTDTATKRKQVFESVETLRYLISLQAARSRHDGEGTRWGRKVKEQLKGLCARYALLASHDPLSHLPPPCPK